MVRSAFLAGLLSSVCVAEPYTARVLTEHNDYYDGFPSFGRAFFSTSGSGYSILDWNAFAAPVSATHAGNWYVRPPGTSATYVEINEPSYMDMSVLTFAGARFQSAHWANDGPGYDDFGYRASENIDGATQVFGPPADWSFNSCGSLVCWLGGWDWQVSNRRIATSESGWAAFVGQTSIITYPHPTFWQDAAFALSPAGTMLHVATYDSCLEFDCSGISAARVDDTGNVYVLRGDSNVVKWTRSGSTFTDETMGFGGLTGLLPGSFDANNFYVLGDGSLIALGLWDVEIGEEVQQFPALFVKRPGQGLEIRVTPNGDRHLSAALSPFALGSDGKKKIRWAIYCNSMTGHQTLYSGRSLPDDDGFLDWSDHVVQEATALQDLNSPPPASGYEGEFANWNAIDSVGRVLLVRHMDDRDSFDPVNTRFDRVSQIARLEPPLCIGDINEDGLVDDADFTIFLVQYELLAVTPADPAADFNLDGFVDDGDFTLFTAAYDNLVCE